MLRTTATLLKPDSKKMVFFRSQNGRLCFCLFLEHCQTLSNYAPSGQMFLPISHMGLFICVFVFVFLCICVLVFVYLYWCICVFTFVYFSNTFQLCPLWLDGSQDFSRGAISPLVRHQFHGGGDTRKVNKEIGIKMGRSTNYNQ